MELGHASDRLRDEFAGIFSPETVEEVLQDSALRWKEAPIQAHVPVLAERFAKERLKAVAQAGGQIVKEVPEVLFVCVHNAGRSQMAAALLHHHAAGRVHAKDRAQSHQENHDRPEPRHRRTLSPLLWPEPRGRMSHRSLDGRRSDDSSFAVNPNADEVESGPRGCSKNSLTCMNGPVVEELHRLRAEGPTGPADFSH
jgi:hypothetical protein